MRKIMIIALFAGILLPHNNFAQQVKKYPSLLWEITGNGLKQPSYLYGTMHVSERVAFHLSDTFFVALKKCDVVALESDPTTWLNELVNDKSMGSLQRGFSRYNNSFFETHFQLSEFDKGDIRNMLSADPSLINGMMYRMNYGRANYEEDTYLDMFIFQAGKKLGKKVTNLEDYKKSNEMVEKAYKREKDEKYEYDYDYEDDLLKGRDLYELIEDAYRKGDLDMLDSLTNMRSPTKNYRKWMLDERNKVMVHGMDSIMKNQTLFTAVGAAHLPGKMGVIEMLREKGYTVRPVKYTATKNAIKTKEKIEKMRLPVEYSAQSVDNGMISFQAPGKMYEIPFYKQDAKIYLGLEMVNGSYHLITRLRSRILMENKTPEYFSKQLDSMLFENLPGKILFKKHLKSAEGYPVIETAVKTRNADVMRYKIFVTPFEIIVFSLGARGDMAMEKESAKFFDNISFTPVVAGWSDLSLSDYTVKLPQARLNYSSNGSASGAVDAFDPKDSTYFIVMSGSYNDLENLESDTFELSYLSRSFYREKENITLVSRTWSENEKYPVLSSVYKDDKNRYTHLKFYVRKDNYFMQASFGKSAVPQAEFFNSFRILPAEDTCKYKEYSDSSYYFHVNIPQSIHEDQSEIFENYYEDYYYNYDDDEEEIDRSHEGERGSRTFSHPYSGEVAEVSYERYPKYRKESPIDTVLKYKSFMDWNEREYRHAGLKYTEENGKKVISYYLKDTASVRVIRIKVIYHNGTAYKLKFYTDTISAPSKFETEFFTSFRPADTVIGTDIFTDKRELFYQDLQGDSTHRAQALESVRSINFKDEDAPKLIAEMKKIKNWSKKTEVRTSMIYELGLLEHKEILPFLKDYYAAAGDTSYVQHAVLEAMLFQRTAESFGVFLNCITSNTPLTENSYDVNRIFYPADDSLELAVKLFPKLLELTQYDEYKYPVYTLAQRLIDSNLLKKDMLVEKKNVILRDANEDLKRILSDRMGSDEEGDVYIPDAPGMEFSLDDIPHEMRKEVMKELDKLGMSFEEAMGKYGTPGMDYEYAGNKDRTFELNRRLLLNFRDDASVKQFFDKIDKSGNKQLILDTRLLYLENKIDLPDSVWKNYSADPKLRTEIYSRLKANKKENLFDTAYYNQQSFVESEIIRHERVDLKEDSLVFLEKHFVKNGEDTGYLYVYKLKEKDRENWNLVYYGYQPEDLKKVSDDYSFIREKYMSTRKQRKMDEEIKEFLEELSYEGHPRINPGKNTYYDDYYYDDY